jgi:competence protein ComEC
MLSFAESASLFKRRSDPLTSLSFAAVLMALVNPAVITSAGFLLSVGSVAGISTLSLPVEKAITPFNAGKLLKLLIKSVSVTISAQAGAALPLLFIFGSLPLLGIIANLPAVPLLNLTILSSIAAIIFRQIFPPLGSLISFFASLLAKLIILISQFISKLPFSQFNLKERYQAVWFIAFYLLLACPVNEGIFT